MATAVAKEMMPIIARRPALQSGGQGGEHGARVAWVEEPRRGTRGEARTIFQLGELQLLEFLGVGRAGGHAVVSAARVRGARAARAGAGARAATASVRGPRPQAAPGEGVGARRRGVSGSGSLQRLHEDEEQRPLERAGWRQRAATHPPSQPATAATLGRRSSRTAGAAAARAAPGGDRGRRSILLRSRRSPRPR